MFNGSKRPPFAKTPKLGQESVWDYPRPPAIVPDSRLVSVKNIAETKNSVRILETASPPTFYIPSSAIRVALLRLNHSSHCEWKGLATYWALPENPKLPIGWSYESPNSRYMDIKGHIAFYPSRIDCFVDGIKVQAQQSEFYGGWITPEIVGPFKGEPGTLGW